MYYSQWHSKVKVTGFQVPEKSVSAKFDYFIDIWDTNLFELDWRKLIPEFLNKFDENIRPILKTASNPTPYQQTCRLLCGYYCYELLSVSLSNKFPLRIFTFMPFSFNSV